MSSMIATYGPLPSVDSSAPSSDLPPSLLVSETQFLFDKYKNAFGWDDKTLCLKK